MIRGGWRFMGHKTVAAIYQQIAGLMLLYKPGRAFTDGPESGHRAQIFSLLIKPIRGARSACIMA